MKFVCDACGKKYATAEAPSAGKVYKLKCKACGHLIVVKAQAGTSTAIPAMTSGELAPGAPESPPPELEIEVVPEHAAQPPGKAAWPPPPPSQEAPVAVDDDAIIQDPAPLPPEVANAIDGAAPVPDTSAGGRGGLPLPPPPDKDELADFAASIATPVPGSGPGAVPKAGYVDLFADGITGERPVKPEPLPIARPATGKVPGPPPKVERVGAAKAAASGPVKKAKAPDKKGPSPLIFVALGALLIGGITAVAVTTAGKKGPPAPVAVAPAPTPAPAPPRVEPPPVATPAVKEPPAKEAPPKEQPAPAPRPVVVEKKPEPKPEPKAEAPRPRPVERKPEPRPEPKPEPKVAVAPPPAPAPEPVEPRTETREVQLQDAETALTPEVVQKVINANRKAFATCISAAGSDVRLDGRKVALKLTVNANGAVTYPTIDDVTLNPTEMGQCLKSAARLMIFPKFKGDPFHVEVPLTLSN